MARDVPYRADHTLASGAIEGLQCGIEAIKGTKPLPLEVIEGEPVLDVEPDRVLQVIGKRRCFQEWVENTSCPLEVLLGR